MHVPFNLAPTVSKVLKRSVSKGTVEVMMQQVNQAAWKYLGVQSVWSRGMHRQTQED